MTGVEASAAARAKGRILIVDDELVVRDSLGKWFVSEGYQAKPVASAREALEAIQQMEYDIALIDIKMPGMDGMELQNRLREADQDLTVIIMTGYASVETAVQALKRGAYDYITKPVDPDELSHLVGKALEHKRARREVARLRENLQEVFPSTELIGKSPAMKKVMENIEMVAPTDATVLITGESGTGKEVVARAIHAASPRRYMPMVAIHCGALTETLLESELFGHERGAFTGAQYAAARAPGRHSAAGQPLPQQVLHGDQPAGPGRLAGCHGPAHAARLARQRSRTGKLGGARAGGGPRPRDPGARLFLPVPGGTGPHGPHARGCGAGAY
ncbi:MAG: sigma-54-dependent transcriptional regulator [Bryobacteraceae bacterium]